MRAKFVFLRQSLRSIVASTMHEIRKGERRKKKERIFLHQSNSRRHTFAFPLVLAAKSFLRRGTAKKTEGKGEERKGKKRDFDHLHGGCSQGLPQTPVLCHQIKWSNRPQKRRGEKKGRKKKKPVLRVKSRNMPNKTPSGSKIKGERIGKGGGEKIHQTG